MLVTTRSTTIAPITGPAAFSPSSATSSGTPMKPAFGNAATSAPKAASRSVTPPGRPARCTVTAIVKAMISQRGDDVDGEQDGIGEPADRQARAEAKQHARQGEEQHVGVEPRDRAFGQPEARGGEPAEQHQREERDRDGEDGLHAGRSIASCCLALAP